ncbi:unnamed protein product [Spirodela intermedia]|uniref:Uncharacterized protein n=1 Tax=Spirodela intermedia TaxID=51605 RepID=A0A7I8KKR3_SPIIN|nr:unnamed protein product [Spirodela intermedia]
METASVNMAVVAPPSTAASGSNDSLAIVPDKRPAHRPGGCVGVLFQFFDWNRRLAKKRFFSRKLLPRDRASKSISKASGEERTPVTKPQMIADENTGGFPNGKMVKADNGIRSSVSNSEREKPTSSPGLVARLMGLESMPATSRNGKPRKAVDDVSFSDASNVDRSGAAVCSDSGDRAKPELGPQKPRKTGFFDGRPVSAARSCSEALAFNRSMITRSRKPNKRLASPVKSPRLAGRRSSARLMEAASRILEPGLQARNRTRYALRNSSPPTEESPNVSATFVSPCHNCGSLVEVPEVRREAGESAAMAEYEPSSSSSSYSFSDLSSFSPHSGFHETVPAPPHFSSERKRAPPAPVEAKPSGQTRSHHFASSFSPKKDSLRQREIPQVREEAFPPPRPGTREWERRGQPSSFTEPMRLSAPRSPSHPMTRPSKAMDIQRLEIRGVGKSRAGNTNNGAKLDLLHSSFSKRKAATSDLPDRKVPNATSPRSIYGNSSRGELQGLGSGRNGGGVLLVRRNGAERGGDADSLPESSGTESRDGNSVSKRLLDQRIDALSVLLGQKIREFTCSGPDLSASTDDVQSARSAAAVLEELISALSVAARPPPPKTEGNLSLDLRGPCCASNKGFPKRPKLVAIPRFQDEVMLSAVSARPRHGSGGYEQRSPMSILEASFLNDSCLSESFNSSSDAHPKYHLIPNRRAQVAITASSIDESPSWDLDTDLSDSGKSTTTFRRPSEIKVPGAGSWNGYIWEVISNAELIFRGASPIVPLLLETLETTAEEPRLRRLLFDCMIEHLDVKYAQFCGAGFRAWLKLPSLCGRELRRELCDKIRACGGPRRGRTLEEMIEEEASDVNGRWADFQFEAFEWGVDLEDDLLRILVNEIVSDLLIL